MRPRAQSWESPFPPGKRRRWFPAIVTSGSALSPDPFCWQAQSPPDPSDNHFSGNVEREKWGSVLISTVLGPVGKKPGLFLFWGVGGGSRLGTVGKVSQPAGNTCLLPGRPGESHSTLVFAFGPDSALPSIPLEHKVIIVGLDNAGKTTILYQL